MSQKKLQKKDFRQKSFSPPEKSKTEPEGPQLRSQRVAIFLVNLNAAALVTALSTFSRNVQYITMKEDCWKVIRISETSSEVSQTQRFEHL